MYGFLLYNSIKLYAVSTLYNVCSVPWGDIVSAMGGYCEYHRDVQYHRGYHEKLGVWNILHKCIILFDDKVWYIVFCLI